MTSIIYVAMITAGAGILGATIPQVSVLLRDVRKDERDQRKQHADGTRQACVELVRAANELRTQVANNRSFQGSREVMGERLEAVRSHADQARFHAINVGMLAHDPLAEPAERLATAAGTLADVAVQSTDLDLGRMVADPAFHDLDACIAAFRVRALGYAKATRAEPDRARGRLGGARHRDAAAVAQDQ